MGKVVYKVTVVVKAKVNVPLAKPEDSLEGAAGAVYWINSLILYGF